MGIESQFGRGPMGPEGKEDREDTPSDIYIYASEHERGTIDTVTEQGFGYSMKLDTPQRSTTYHWEGILHPTAHEGQNPSSREAYEVSRNAQDSLADLAKNFSLNYLGHLNEKLEERGEASYTFSFEPPKEIAEQSKYAKGRGEKNGIRALTEAEEEQFLEAFRQANQEAIKKTKKQ